MRLGDHDRVLVATGVHVREFEGELIILDLARGDYFGLDEVGARMWVQLAAGRTLREVAEVLSAEYGEPVDRVLDDARHLVEALLERGLAVVAAKAQP